MHIIHRLTNWLETHWVNPAYSGWVLAGLTIFFFGAATNSMAGWLYAISGVSLALIAIAIILPLRSLNGLTVKRLAVQPVSAGDSLAVEILVDNPTSQPKTLLQIRDVLPYVLAPPQKTVIETIAAGSTHRWSYSCPTQRRGVYRWHTVDLRTATPLGLFWCRRPQKVDGLAVVYPTVLPLARCPLLDEMGEESSQKFDVRDRRPQTSSEGMTRSLRPYRWGDPTRLVHWRTSARYGELRVRELEIFSGGQEIVIGLDSAGTWQSEAFEEAAIAAASLYFYGRKRQIPIRLWTAGTGLLMADRVVLEALAATYPGEAVAPQVSFPKQAVVWLTQNPASLDTLPSGSRWLLWPQQASALGDARDLASGTVGVTDASSGVTSTSGPAQTSLVHQYPGLTIHSQPSLQQQLQMSLR